MSNSLLNRVWALKDERVRMGTRLVLLALSDRANDHGVCWPSVETLAGDAGLTTRQVRRALGVLAEAGYVSAERRGGRGKASVYVLSLPQKADMDGRLPGEKADIYDSSGEKADMDGRLPGEKADIYDSSANQKADISHINPDILCKKADIYDQKADIASHTREEPPIEPSENHQEPPGVFVGVPPTHTGSPAVGRDASAFGEEWERFLNALTWFCHGHHKRENLTEAQRGALTGEGKRMFAAGFRRDDLQRWLDDEWRRQWAGHFAKHGSYPRPRPDQVRAGIDAVRSRYGDPTAEESRPQAKMLDPGPGATKPTQDEPWAALVRELLRTMPHDSPARGWLTGSRLERGGEVEGVPLYRVELDDATGVAWVRDRLGPRLRREVSSLMGVKVLVEVGHG